MRPLLPCLTCHGTGRCITASSEGITREKCHDCYGYGQVRDHRYDPFPHPDEAPERTLHPKTETP